MTIKGKPLVGKHCGKGKNGDNQHFIIIPEFFLSYQSKFEPFGSHSNCCLQKLSIKNLRQAKILLSGKGLIWLLFFLFFDRALKIL